MTTPSKLHIVKMHPDALTALRKRHSPGAAKIATGFIPRPALNLVDHGGRTLADLKFVNIYLGNWSSSDISSIDTALSGALTDPSLNHVIQQYFQLPVTTRFLGNAQRSDESLVTGTVYDRDAVHATLASLDLSAYDLATTVICLYLPEGVILDTTSAGPGGVGNEKQRAVSVGGVDGQDNSKQGLGGYHGSAQIGGETVLFAVAVYSDAVGGDINGIPQWPDPWKNIVATMYHELNEVRTDPDVEASMRQNSDGLLGWYSDRGGEIGDIPMSEAGANLSSVMMEVPLASGGTAPIQLMWSNEVGGPGMPY